MKSKMGQRYGSFTEPVIDLEKGDVGVVMKKLRAEQLDLRVEIQKLKEQQENMEKEFSRVQGMENSGNGDDEERIISSFSLEFIHLVKEKLRSSEVTGKRKMGADNEPGSSSSGSGKKKKGDEVEIEPELQCADEGKNEENARRNAENSAFWKKMFEDDSDAENGVEEVQPLQDSKIMVELDDMLASKIAMEGESLISKIAGLEEEEDEAHLQLWT